MLVAQVTPQVQDAQRIAQHLFNLLICLPIDRNITSYTNHDFHGALKHWDPSNSSEAWNFLKADPNALGPFPSTQVSTFSADTLPISPSTSTDCFSELSLEMRHMIIAFLDSSDFCNLRLASRSIACRTSPAHLPQSYWASRFALDKEMGFFPLDYGTILSSYQVVDWRGWYFDIKHTLLDSSAAGYLRNRRRIWRCLCYISTCLIPLLNQDLILRDDFYLELALSSKGYQRGQKAHGAPKVDEDPYSGTGMWQFGSQYLVFHSAKPTAYPIQISASFIAYNCDYYICGMRETYQDQDRTHATSELSRVGMTIPHSERSITIDPQSRIVGICVASSVCGIVGLGVVTVNQSGQRSVKRLGIIDNLPDGVGVAMLEPRSGHEISGAVIGFDVSLLGPWHVKLLTILFRRPINLYLSSYWNLCLTRQPH